MGNKASYNFFFLISWIYIGPLLYDYKAFNGSFPSFVDNQYSWTQVILINYSLFIWKLWNLFVWLRQSGGNFADCQHDIFGCTSGHRLLLLHNPGRMAFLWHTFNQSNLPIYKEGEKTQPWNNVNALNIFYLDNFYKRIFSNSMQWILEHPRFSKNPLYITGDSYSGMIVPMVTLEIAMGMRLSLKSNA